MTEESLLQAVQDLIAIESTAENTAGLRAAYDYMVTFVRANNPDVTIEGFESNGKPSLLAYRGTRRPDNFHVILNGHIDVVPGEPAQYKPHVRDGKLYGRGVYDMKAAAIILARVFCEYVDKVPYALGLQIVTDEEPGGADGSLYQVEQGVRADFVICGECGRLPGTYEIANGSKGVVFANIEITGETAHSAYPWRAKNAAMHAARFVHALHDVYPSPETECHTTTVTVTGISSTTGLHNKIPEHALVMVDCRFVPEDPNFESEDAFRAFIAGVDPEAVITSFPVFIQPTFADPNHSVMLDLKHAAETTESHTFSYVRRHGGSDTRHYFPVGGQACEFGIVGEDQHGNDEHITLEAFGNYLATMRSFLEKTILTEQSNAKNS